MFGCKKNWKSCKSFYFKFLYYRSHKQLTEYNDFKLSYNFPSNYHHWFQIIAQRDFIERHRNILWCTNRQISFFRNKCQESQGPKRPVVSGKSRSCVLNMMAMTTGVPPFSEATTHSGVVVHRLDNFWSLFRKNNGLIPLNE